MEAPPKTGGVAVPGWLEPNAGAAVVVGAPANWKPPDVPGVDEPPKLNMPPLAGAEGALDPELDRKSVV